MRICRFDHPTLGQDRLGIVLGADVADITALLAHLPPITWPLPFGDVLVAHWHLLAPQLPASLAAAPRAALDTVRLRCPLTNPSKVIGIARNRRDLGTENTDPAMAATAEALRRDGDPIRMFIKANSGLAGPADGIAIRFPDQRTDPEAELTVIIGRPGTDIPRAHAMDHVFGYCIGMDMTLRGPESPSSRKSLDGYALIGPWIVTADEIPAPDEMDTLLRVNGQDLARANTRDLAFNVASLVSHASRFYTLHPGDAIMVGTPAAFAPVHAGDLLTADFTGIGRMDIRLRAH